MPAYMSLFNFTEQGLRNLKDMPGRLQALRQQTEAQGGRIIGVWFTQGQYDGVVIWESPDEEVATRGLLQIGKNGNFRTTTLRAFNEEEMGRIIQGLT